MTTNLDSSSSAPNLSYSGSFQYSYPQSNSKLSSFGSSHNISAYPRNIKSLSKLEAIEEIVSRMQLIGKNASQIEKFKKGLSEIITPIDLKNLEKNFQKIANQAVGLALTTFDHLVSETQKQALRHSLYEMGADPIIKEKSIQNLKETSHIIREMKLTGESPKIFAFQEGLSKLIDEMDTLLLSPDEFAGKLKNFLSSAKKTFPFLTDAQLHTLSSALEERWSRPLAYGSAIQKLFFPDGNVDPKNNDYKKMAPKLSEWVETESVQQKARLKKDDGDVSSDDINSLTKKLKSVLGDTVKEKEIYRMAHSLCFQWQREFLENEMTAPMAKTVQTQYLEEETESLLEGFSVADENKAQLRALLSDYLLLNFNEGQVGRQRAGVSGETAQNDDLKNQFKHEILNLISPTLTPPQKKEILNKLDVLEAIASLNSKIEARFPATDEEDKMKIRNALTELQTNFEKKLPPSHNFLDLPNFYKINLIRPTVEEIKTILAKNENVSEAEIEEFIDQHLKDWMKIKEESDTPFSLFESHTPTSPQDPMMKALLSGFDVPVEKQQEIYRLINLLKNDEQEQHENQPPLDRKMIKDTIIELINPRKGELSREFASDNGRLMRKLSALEIDFATEREIEKQFPNLSKTGKEEVRLLINRMVYGDMTKQIDSFREKNLSFKQLPLNSPRRQSFEKQLKKAEESGSIRHLPLQVKEEWMKPFEKEMQIVLESHGITSEVPLNVHNFLLKFMFL